MISYQKIVFGLKEHRRLYECATFMERSRNLRCIISEHDSFAEDCERPGLHYHGIVEHETAENISSNEALVQLRKYCAYLKIEECKLPRQCIKELIKPPKKVMILETSNSLYLRSLYSEIPNVVAIECEQGQYEHETFKRQVMRNIITIIFQRRIFDHVELHKLIENNNYEFTQCELDKVVIDSIDLVRQKMLNLSILELCKDFVERSENYLTPLESIDLVLEWCQFQNINVETFTVDWINCLDQQVSFKNTIYFEGTPDSGVKSIINSIKEVSTFVGEVDNESTGYTYVWEECVENRCIVMQDPVIDECKIQILEKIFRGIGTYVPHRRNGLEFLRRTPVILSCYKKDLERDFHLKHLQSSFLNSYVNLKPFMKLHAESRLLHPDWLNVMYRHFTDTRIDPVNSEDDGENEMDCGSSFDSNDGDVTSYDVLH